MALADKSGVCNRLSSKRVQRSYKQILRQIRIIFSKQLEVYDFHKTLLEKEREDFIKDVSLLKLFIENEKRKVKQATKTSVQPNSEENNASAYSDSDSDEPFWSNEDYDDGLLLSTEYTGDENMGKSRKGLVDMNREEEIEKEICAGIGKKDF